MKKRGFTLVELLVVITIISIIASMVITVAAQMQEKARVENTRATILVLHSACETYKGDFFLYPDIHNFPTSTGTVNTPVLHYDGEAATATPTTNFSDGTPATAPPAGVVLDNGGFNADSTPKNGSRRLRYLLRRPFEIDEAVKESYLQKDLVSIDPADPTLANPAPTATPNKDSDDLFVDAWGNFLRILPGRNHSNAVTSVAPNPVIAAPSPGNNPVGPNYFDNTRNRTPLDIYSVGPNGVDNTNGDYNVTNFDITIQDQPNEADNRDDIVNWFAERAK